MNPAADIPLVAGEKDHNSTFELTCTCARDFSLLAVDELVPTGKGLAASLEVDLLPNLTKGGETLEAQPGSLPDSHQCSVIPLVPLS